MEVFELKIVAKYAVSFETAYNKQKFKH